MSDEKLMTVQEFNAQVLRWAEQVRSRARMTLRGGTHGSGHLADKLQEFVDTAKHLTASLSGEQTNDAAAYRIAFRFDRYGVFRAYGVGRGWARVNGTLQRGFRARSEREIRNRQWNDYTTDLTKKGYTVGQINRAKYTSQGIVVGKSKERTPLDWIDQHINSSIGVLAEYVQEYYGDVAMRQLLDGFGKMCIVK